MRITAETTQTYDLYKSDTARSYDSTLFEILPAQHEVKRQKRSKDQTENGTCKNVTNRRSRVASQPQLIILHTVKFAEVLWQEAHGSYRSIRQSYQKIYLICVQFFVRMCNRL